MTLPRKPRKHGSTNGATSEWREDENATVGSLDASAFGFAKAAYSVGEALHLLSIGRTSLYAAVKRGDLKHVESGRKTLFYAGDLVRSEPRMLKARRYKSA